LPAKIWPLEKGDVHNGCGQSLLALLQDLQQRYNYLPEESLREIAQKHNLSLMEIYSVATFYKSFSLRPRGRHKIVVCSGTACHVRGSEKVADELSRIFNLQPGDTAEDGEYSLETVNCLGACALAPLVVVDGEYHGNMTAAIAATLFKERLKKMKEYSAESFRREIAEKALAGCSCAEMLAGEDRIAPFAEGEGQ